LCGCGSDGDGTGGSGAASATGGSGGTSGGGASGGTSGGGASGGTSGGGASGGTGGVGGSSSGGYAGIDPNADCPGKLLPVEAAGHIETVGNGTPGSCTEQALADAVAAVNAVDGGGTVLFDCGGAQTIQLSKSIFVAKSMILDGGGNITLSGGGAVRVIELDHYLDFTLQRITIRDGFVRAGSENESGAGLLSPWFGTLLVIDATFENNHSASTDHDVGGGAIYAGGLTKAVISGCTFTGNSGSTGGGVLSRSTNLTVVDSVFYENSATTYGDGQYGNGGGLYIDRMWLDAPTDFVLCGSVFQSNHAKVHGSALFSYNLEGTGATFDRTTFADNDMAGSPGGGTGTVYHQGVPLLLVRSTFSTNSTGEHAGGLFLGGGTDATVENCTFVGNSTPGNAGALWAGDGNVSVTNCTFAENSADYGPVFFKGDAGAILLTNVILAQNRTENEFSALACHDTFDDGGGNIQWPETKRDGSSDLPCTNGVRFADPALVPLADNGGPTQTLAISAGSPAIDVAQVCPELDQRGMPRVGKCDSGAFEFQP
jgi:predicted outer membrane repeat protein